MIVEFNDKRPRYHLPTDEDYETPLSKASLAKANNRFRQSGVPRVIHNDREKAASIVSAVTRQRFKDRKNSGQDFESIGEYLEFLNAIGNNEH